MVPVTVRFTPTTAELEHIRTALRKQRPRPSIPLAISLSVLFLVQGVMHVAYPRRGADEWIGYAQIVLGVVYAPLTWVGSVARLSFPKTDCELELRIDDAGITMTESATLVPWKSIDTIVDVGDAFIFTRSWDRHIAILTRALPDGGSALWAALDAELTATRYLVRTTAGRRRIINGLKKN